MFETANKEAVGERGRFVVALAGGATPRRLYELLAARREQLYWPQTHVLWGDERWVPPTDERSNEKMAREALLDVVPIPMEQIYPLWPGVTASERYTALLNALGPIDLLLLGMGADGHTASLFPGMPDVLDETSKVLAVTRPDGEKRISLAPQTLREARQRLVMVSGADKADRLREVLKGPQDVQRLPVQLVTRLPGTLIYADQAAAALVAG